MLLLLLTPCGLWPGCLVVGGCFVLFACQGFGTPQADPYFLDLRQVIEEFDSIYVVNTDDTVQGAGVTRVRAAFWMFAAGLCAAFWMFAAGLSWVVALAHMLFVLCYIVLCFRRRWCTQDGSAGVLFKPSGDDCLVTYGVNASDMRNASDVLQQQCGIVATSRSWYTSAVAAGGGVWSHVYIGSNTGALMTTYSEPIYNSTGVCLCLLCMCRCALCESAGWRVDLAPGLCVHVQPFVFCCVVYAGQLVGVVGIDLPLRLVQSQLAARHHIPAAAAAESMAMVFAVPSLDLLAITEEVDFELLERRWGALTNESHPDLPTLDSLCTCAWVFRSSPFHRVAFTRWVSCLSVCVHSAVTTCSGRGQRDHIQLGRDHRKHVGVAPVC